MEDCCCCGPVGYNGGCSEGCMQFIPSVHDGTICQCGHKNIRHRAIGKRLSGAFSILVDVSNNFLFLLSITVISFLSFLLYCSCQYFFLSPTHPSFHLVPNTAPQSHLHIGLPFGTPIPCLQLEQVMIRLGSFSPTLRVVSFTISVHEETTKLCPV